MGTYSNKDVSVGGARRHTPASERNHQVADPKLYAGGLRSSRGSATATYLLGMKEERITDRVRERIRIAIRDFRIMQ